MTANHQTENRKPVPQDDNARADVRRHFEALGFVLESTGGNCTAFVRRYPDGTEHIITSTENELTAPERLDEGCLFQLWRDGAVIGDEDCCGSVEEVLSVFAHVDGLAAGAPDEVRQMVEQEQVADFDVYRAEQQSQVEEQIDAEEAEESR